MPSAAEIRRQIAHHEIGHAQAGIIAAAHRGLPLAGLAFHLHLDDAGGECAVCPPPSWSAEDFAFVKACSAVGPVVLIPDVAVFRGVVASGEFPTHPSLSDADHRLALPAGRAFPVQAAGEVLLATYALRGIMGPALARLTTHIMRHATDGPEAVNDWPAAAFAPAPAVQRALQAVPAMLKAMHYREAFPVLQPMKVPA